MPAVEVTSRIVVRASRQQVWDVLAAVSAWPDWTGVAVDVTRADPLAVGAALAYRLRMAGVPVPFAVTVTACDPPALVTWSSRKWTVRGTRTFSLTETADGAEVTDRKHFSHRWAPLAWFYPVGVIERMSRAFLADLETEVTRRYGGDGR